MLYPVFPYPILYFLPLTLHNSASCILSFLIRSCMLCILSCLSLSDPVYPAYCICLSLFDPVLSPSYSAYCILSFLIRSCIFCILYPVFHYPICIVFLLLRLSDSLSSLLPITYILLSYFYSTVLPLPSSSEPSLGEEGGNVLVYY